MDTLFDLFTTIFPDYKRDIAIFFLGSIFGFFIGCLYSKLKNVEIISDLKHKINEPKKSIIVCPLRGGIARNIPVTKDPKTNEVLSVDCVYCKNKQCVKDNMNKPCMVH